MINPCPSHQTLFIVTPSHQPTWILKTLHSHFLSRAPSESPESHRQRLGSSLGKSSTDDFHITSPRLWMQFTFYSCVCLYILHSPQLILSILYLSGHLQLNQHRWLGFVSTDHKISGKRLKTCQCVSISEGSRPSMCTLCTLCTHNSQVYTFYLKCLIIFLKNWWTRDGTGSHLVTFANVNSFESIYLGFWVLVVFPFLRTSFIPPKSE